MSKFSSLIEVNPHNPSIRSIDFGNLRLTHFGNQNAYRIRISFCDIGVHYSQETYVLPSQLEHVVEIDQHGEAWVVLRDVDNHQIFLSVACQHAYASICELFSMPVSDAVIHAFEIEEQLAVKRDAVTESNSEA